MNMLNNLPDEVLASLYISTITIVLLVGIIVLYSRLRMHDSFEKRLYSVMVIVTILLAASYVFEDAVFENVIVVSPAMNLLEGAVHDMYINGLCLAWIIYANYRMYRNIDYIKRKMFIYVVPFTVLLVLNTINIFVPVLVYFGDDGMMHDTRIYVIQDLIRYGYMIISILQIISLKKQGDKVRFFSITPLLIPVALGSVCHNLSPKCYPILPFGIAMGLTLLYAQIANEQSFCDDETKFFNRSYLNYIFELVVKGRYKVNSIMSFKTKDPEKIKELAELIREQLPSQCEPVRITQNEIMVLSAVDERAPLFMVTEDVKMVVEEYNENHPDDPIDVKTSMKIKKKKETGTGFLLKQVEGYL